MRRTPAAIDSSLAILKKAMSPVRRTWVPPQSSFDGPSVTTRTVSPYFSPKIIMAPVLRASSMASSAVSPPAFWRTSSLTRASTRWSSSVVSGWKWAKSKRSASGPTTEPACLTCSPSVSRSARWSRWVAEWLARIRSRRARSTVSSTRSPTCSSPSATLPRWVTRPGTGRCASVTSTVPRGPPIIPVSPTWPPDSP